MNARNTAIGLVAQLMSSTSPERLLSNVARDLEKTSGDAIPAALAGDAGRTHGGGE